MVAVYVGGALLILVVVLAIYVSLQPNEFKVERSAEVAAPPLVVFNIINDLHQWTSWSPYDVRDPNMQKTIAGSGTGPGSSYAWNGNSQVGEGKMTIVETRPGELVAMSLEFSRPFRCNNAVSFTMAPSGSGSRVTWSMVGKSNVMSKLMSLVMNMDKMVGTDFEQGLKNLNQIAIAKRA